LAVPGDILFYRECRRLPFLSKGCGIDYEIFQLGPRPIRDCIGCNKCQGKGCIFKDDNDDTVNRFLEKAKEADGFVFGTPVYFAHPSGQILSFLNRVFYSSAVGELYPVFAGKPGAAIASAAAVPRPLSMSFRNISALPACPSLPRHIGTWSMA
jgi:multimeric flavodoxin WrbA